MKLIGDKQNLDLGYYGGKFSYVGVGEIIYINIKPFIALFFCWTCLGEHYYRLDTTIHYSKEGTVLLRVEGENVIVRICSALLLDV